MHYYHFNIADYRKDTTHLNPLEHYIYRQLIDWYFLDEKPITNNLKIVIRRLGLNELDHLHLLENVLLDFFVENNNKFHHKRIDLELEKYKSQAEKNKINGKKGGRPKAKITQVVSDGLPSETKINPNQEPITKNQEPITNKDQEKGDLSPVGDEPEAPPERNKIKKQNIPYQKIVDLYHSTLPELPQVKELSNKRKSYIRQRWLNNLGDMENWGNFFQYIRMSPFLMGKVDPKNGKRVFVPNLEWLTTESNYIKIYEGNYHDKQ